MEKVYNEKKWRSTDNAVPLYSTIIADRYTMGRKYHIRRERGTPDHLFQITLAGSGIVQTGEESHESRPGTIWIYPPEVRQDYRTNPKSGKWEFLWMHVHAPARFLPLLDLPVLGDGVRTFEATDLPRPEYRRTIALFKDAVISTKRNTPLEIQLAMNLLENALIRIRKHIADKQSGFAEKVGAYISEHISEPLSIPELARTVHLSPSRFAHLFKDEMGVAPQIYIERQRMEVAKRIMAINGGNVKSAALSAGFPDQRYFAKRFRHFYGITPTERTSR